MILNQSKNIKFNKTNTETWKVYFLIDNNKVVYIGCTNNIIKRLDSHANWYNPYNSVRTKMYVGKKEFDSYRYIEINDKTKAYKLESKLIKKHQPKYNKINYYRWVSTGKKYVCYKPSKRFGMKETKPKKTIYTIMYWKKTKKNRHWNYKK